MSSPCSLNISTNLIIHYNGKVLGTGLEFFTQVVSDDPMCIDLSKCSLYVNNNNALPQGEILLHIKGTCDRYEHQIWPK